MRRDLLLAAEGSGERLRRLIERLLTVSRIEAGGGELAIGPVPLPDLARRVVEELTVRGNGHDVRIMVGEDVPTLVTDAGKLHQILSNLVENALKYSPPGTQVTVRARAEADAVVLSVTDGGPGIPTEHQERIFDRFYQVDSSSTRSVGGTGLGLYICRRLAEELGGGLWLERSDARGSVFSLRLPRTAS